MFESYNVENLDEILSENFPHLMNLNWHTCARNRKKKSNGEYVIAEIKALNPFMNYLSIDEGCNTGYDIVLIFDKNVLDNVPEESRTNLIKLMLKTVDYDEKIKIKKFSILDSRDVSDDEIDLYERLQLIAEQVYETED